METPEELQKERDAYLDGWRRSKADFENYKKDELKRLEDMAKFGSEDLIRELLSILDSFAALEKVVGNEKENDGVIKIKDQMGSILKKRGLEKIEASPGTKFDPAFHEAVQEKESDGPDGEIVEEVETGWSLHGKVIRATKVIISKQKQ